MSNVCSKNMQRKRDIESIQSKWAGETQEHVSSFVAWNILSIEEVLSLSLNSFVIHECVFLNLHDR